MPVMLVVFCGIIKFMSRGERLDQIPPEMRQAAEAAGISKFTWYSGRTTSSPLQMEHEEVFEGIDTTLTTVLRGAVRQKIQEFLGLVRTPNNEEPIDKAENTSL